MKDYGLPSTPVERAVNHLAIIRAIIAEHSPKSLADFDFIADLVLAPTRKEEALMLELESAKDALVSVRHQLASVRHEIDAVTEDNRVKTADLRRLHDERDPVKIQLVVVAAIERARADADREITELRATVATQKSELEELRASKRKLRDALERIKEKR
jgi:chromosome segregation ATPase